MRTGPCHVGSPATISQAVSLIQQFAGLWLKIPDFVRRHLEDHFYGIDDHQMINIDWKGEVENFSTFTLNPFSESLEHIECVIAAKSSLFSPNIRRSSIYAEIFIPFDLAHTITGQRINVKTNGPSESSGSSLENRGTFCTACISGYA
ncbi:hypothetical protein AYI68_g4778 [Smittium mucronatum]|uniref:Uncharacterized protein n=1 Tax=Smittium mucronatum TaxID=133383 RepID=A0A1R0GW54_9FUNG|nr:hypothetical protein AYI68_g4778 [Smittium mucronatum]